MNRPHPRPGDLLVSCSAISLYAEAVPWSKVRGTIMRDTPVVVIDAIGASNWVRLLTPKGPFWIYYSPERFHV